MSSGSTVLLVLPSLLRLCRSSAREAVAIFHCGLPETTASGVTFRNARTTTPRSRSNVSAIAFAPKVFNGCSAGTCVAVLLGLVARQRHQPGFGLRRDDRFFARPWSILVCRQRPIGQRPLHAALNRLMVDPNSFPYRTERRILAIGQQHLRPRHLARRFGSRPRKNRQSFNLFVGHRQFDCSPPSCHDPAPRLANRKTRNPPSNHLFHNAGFMESIV